MVFALPQSLLPNNKNLDIWLHQETKEAKVSDSSTSEKKALPSDNLSTWLSTRYAANLSKKAAGGNLDMWLAEKRRKLTTNTNSADLLKWLQPGAQQEDNEVCLRHKAADGGSSPKSANSANTSSAAARLCPALANWEAHASLPLDKWLNNQQNLEAAPVEEKPSSQEEDKGLVWLRGHVAQVNSGFVLPDEFQAPIQSWLVQPPKTPLDDGLQKLSVSENLLTSCLDEVAEVAEAASVDERTTVASWLDQSEFSKQEEDMEPVSSASDDLSHWLKVAPEETGETGQDIDQQGSDEISQWLLVTPAQEEVHGSEGRTRQSSVMTDDGSSIVVLDNEDSKSVASSWKFW